MTSTTTIKRRANRRYLDALLADGAQGGPTGRGRARRYYPTSAMLIAACAAASQAAGPSAAATVVDRASEQRVVAAAAATEADPGRGQKYGSARQP